MHGFFFLSKRQFSVVMFLLLFVSVSAQEKDFYKQMMKESLKLDKEFLLQPLTPELPEKESKEGYIELNVNKKPLPVLGYNYRLNSLLLHSKDSLPIDPKMTVSPYLTMGYTNQEDSEEPSAGANVVSAFFTPVFCIVNPNPKLLLLYLMHMGVLPDDPFVTKESKKEKALRNIKEVYGVTDN